VLEIQSFGFVDEELLTVGVLMGFCLSPADMWQHESRISVCHY